MRVAYAVVLMNTKVRADQMHTKVRANQLHTKTRANQTHSGVARIRRTPIPFVVVVVIVVAAFAVAITTSMARPVSAAKKRTQKPIPATAPGPTAPKDALDRATIVASVKSQALIDGTRLGATVGTPNCAAPTRINPGHTFQCLVPFGTANIPYLVTIVDALTLKARPTFPLVRQADLIAAALQRTTGKANCGRETVRALPVGSIVNCTVTEGKRILTVSVRIKDAQGAVEPA